MYAHITAGVNTTFTPITEIGWAAFQIHQFLDYSVFVLGWCRGVTTILIATPIEHTVEKGEKGSCSVPFEHIQFCEQSMNRSAMKYPWQLSFMADQDQSTHPKGLLGMAPALPADIPSSDVAEAAQKELVSAFDDHYRRLTSSCLGPEVEWDVHLDSQHSAPLVKWHKIVLADPLSFDVCGMPFQSLKTVLYGGKFQDDLKTCSQARALLHFMAGLDL